MIEIYDEVGYIKNILQDGLSKHWKRDVKLLVRYYKSVGIKRSVARDEALKKCENNKGNFTFIQNLQYKDFNNCFDKAWSDKTKLREVRYIDIPKEVLDWFLNLEDTMILSDEDIETERSRRKGIVIKNNKALNFQRVKFLFTLYIWTKIKEAYNSPDRKDAHSLANKNDLTKFKKDADLKPSFIIKREINYMYDLGLIGVSNKALILFPLFIEKYDVFKTEITDENRVRIELLKDVKDKDGNILSEEVGDLHNCGYWLEKQKKGFFVCQGCGREIAYYSNKGKIRVYCKECEVLRHGGIVNTKIIKCIDCGCDVEIDDKDTRTCRCLECQKKATNELAKQRMRAFRERTNSFVTLPPGDQANPANPSGTTL